MNYLTGVIGNVKVSNIALGCMRINSLHGNDVEKYLKTTLDLGYNFYDHADIYGGGVCEELFGHVLHEEPSLRDKMILQSKCAIREDQYDFSKEYILDSVEKSLTRLHTDHLDVLLLHRPDMLMEPEKVAEAFNALKQSGKVLHFGVSNHSPMQIELLQKYVEQPIEINQLQFSIKHAYLLSSGTNVNMQNNDGIVRDGYIRDYCRIHDITIQAWSALQYGFFEGTFINNPKFEKLNEVLSELSQKYAITETAIAIAWILRLPEKMHPLVGSTNITRLTEIAKASNVIISSKDWYKIYLAAGYELP